ncbi:cytochrome c oxidase subunit 4 isoform 1, mitochondrial-like [Sitophilus oryzae]|uniref:Cytochrome c oxidase subunit 4 n=1 Tax=Sitophilus oryzae TaxID=7048 RepID=A0A6J2YSG8_SITOR|nr:cytochrome c oxidase subunit 4 isoform 1, mitochondrial-like [Sitophilus oryzae]
MAGHLFPKAFKTLLKPPVWRNIIQKALISDHERNMIGKREIVGYGWNGQPVYSDRFLFPFPAIRWKEPTCEILALREKEKGDWNNLTCEEKKALYRASFCQTFSEIDVMDQGEWKAVLSLILWCFTIGIWMFFWCKMTIYNVPHPITYDKEHREAQFRRILDLRVNPILGISSKWDYENDCWKK